MITQKFKGDAVELKMEAAGIAAIDVCGASLDQMFLSAFDSAPFLLGLYDAGRMPFSDRVPRDAFVDFMREAIIRFPFTGTFDSYVFILNKIFGDGSGVLLDVPSAGKLNIAVSAASKIEYPLVVTESSGGDLVLSNLIDSSGNSITSRTVAGVDSEYKLNQLIAEIIPAGISAYVSLAFFSLYNFVDNTGSQMVDTLGNRIVFLEH